MTEPARHGGAACWAFRGAMRLCAGWCCAVR